MSTPTPLFNSSFAVPTADADPVKPHETLCPSNAPLVLLPVRLETRFFTLPGNVTELRVRIYPDKIHLDTHERELTSDERTWGSHYWEQDWRAGNDRDARATAWRQLADRFGAPRAAWIARALQPSNKRPDQPVPAQEPLLNPPLLPTLPPVAPGGGEDTWRRAPLARLLPDRWRAVLHSHGRVALSVTGKDVRRPLAVGPDPRATPPNAGGGERLPTDAGMKWMVDFDEAEAAGMAVRFTIPPASLAAGLDSLVVFGVAKLPTVDALSSELAHLLDAHHYTDGLEFLRYGTRTNNTEDRRAGYDSHDPGHARSFAMEVPADPENTPNASLVATALGLSFKDITPTLGRIAQASEDHDGAMRSMNTALWQVGWGYFLSNMIGNETGLGIKSMDWARSHFLNYVRSGGPFPALRCGSQPYGILPVTSLDLWAPDPSEGVSPEEAWLKPFLLSLRENVWRPVVRGVARVGLRQSGVGAGADFADVMQTDGVSHRYLTRGVLGRHYLEHLYALTAQDFTALDAAQRSVSAKLVDLLALQKPIQNPHLDRAFLATSTWPVTAPLVQPGEVSPWRMLEPNYIHALIEKPNIDIGSLLKAGTHPTGTKGVQSLLQVLLRHAMLREIANAAARIAATLPGLDLATLLRDAELVDLVNVPPVNFTWQMPTATLHWKRQLELEVPAITGQHTIREFLEGLTHFTAPSVASLGEFLASLAQLQRLDSETLQTLMQGTLDLSAHRLDAWITSFATRRLTRMTLDGPTGQFVGGYGWLENLRPASVLQPLPAASLPQGEVGPLFAAANDSGFIHAPSLTHASAAALLRNGHLGPSNAPTTDGPFAIDLSSRRVREASRLLDGVRQGQPLGALLGYRVERALHDLKLDRFIAPLRNFAPLTVRARENDTFLAENLAANNVLDGLVLHRKWKDNKASVSGALQADPPSASEQERLDFELAALADAIDGLSDALTAEAAYQVTRGNTSRLASNLAAIAQGDAPPPELEVARMPRSGTSLTHRVLMLMSAPADLNTPGWRGAGARSNAERLLTFWVAKLLGNGRRVRCTIERFDDATAETVETRTLPLSDVGLTPLDMVYGVEADDTATESASLSDIEQQILYHAKHKVGGFAPLSNLRFQHARPLDLGVGELTLFDVLEQARAIRRLLSVARGADPEDLNPPERTGQGSVDFVELEKRVLQAETALNAAQDGLARLISQVPAATAESLRTAIVDLGAFGLGPSVPVSAGGDDPAIVAALARQGQVLLDLCEARRVEGAALRKLPAAIEPRARLGQLVARMHAVFGQSFVVLPRFSLDSAGATELASALAASTQQQDGDPLAVHGWFTRYARVRDPLARLGACLGGAEVLGTGERLNLSIAQLPFVSTAVLPERWVGLPLLPGTELPPSKLSIVVQSPLPVDAALPLTGLLVDEWIEVVPSKQETTALTFQYDPPNSCPPQSILLAVPPVPGQDWTTDSLRLVLMETLDLAKLRAIDSGSLGVAAQYLPALYIPFNAADDAVSTDFTDLTQ